MRADFATLREYLAEVELPPAASGRLVELTELLEGLLAPGWVSEALATDPEAIHALSRAVHQDIPESVDTYLRTRWWTRLTPGTEPPERPLEQQLSLLHREAESLAAGCGRPRHAGEQTHTRYLEDRGRAN